MATDKSLQLVRKKLAVELIHRILERQPIQLTLEVNARFQVLFLSFDQFMPMVGVGRRWIQSKFLKFRLSYLVEPAFCPLLQKVVVTWAACQRGKLGCLSHTPLPESVQESSQCLHLGMQEPRVVKRRVIFAGCPGDGDSP